MGCDLPYIPITIIVDNVKIKIPNIRLATTPIIENNSTIGISTVGH